MLYVELNEFNKSMNIIELEVRDTHLSQKMQLNIAIILAIAIALTTYRIMIFDIRLIFIKY